MGDRMTPIPFGNLMNWVLKEKQNYNKVFGIGQMYRAAPDKYAEIFGEKMETPFGPAAGPNTQLAQNLIASYITGCRFFELKTVQILDGEDLPVAKPCILADDECYNCEWSTELRVPDARNEYIKAWIALKVLAIEYGLGASDGFIFNMSVGYDLKGIQSEKIDNFIETMKEAKDTEEWKRSIQWMKDNIHRFSKVTLQDVEGISSNICTSVTVSTLHGCPPQEIESIASYLLKEKKLNTFVKCNPTLLGYETAREIMDSMGYDYVVFGDFHFKDDLQFEDAVPMLQRLMKLGDQEGLLFGVKITNTFPVDVTRKELPSEEMYMSGKSLCALSLSVAHKLSEAFDGKLRISYSGGADYFNIDKIFDLGIWPITVATTLLKPGGYQRDIQLAKKLTAMEYKPFTGVNVAGLKKLIEEIKKDSHHRKAIKPLPSRKMAKKVPLLECFVAPCSEGCPIHQDIPAYVKLVGEGKYEEALRVILDKNPLPFITGTICNHRCMDKCSRNFYEESVNIRGAKLVAAQGGYESVLPKWKADGQTGTGRKAAVIGGGPAGIAAAHFLARAGVDVTVYEKSGVLGGVVAQVIPGFRISMEDIAKDVELSKALGVKFVLNHPVEDVEALKAEGFDAVFVAVGSSKGMPLGIETEKEWNAVEFLWACKNQPETVNAGKYVVVIGAGNTAMDAARAAKRLPGVEKVSVVYRRTKRYMPADEEELEQALEDGVEFQELLAPKCQKNGVLTCNKVVLGEMDASGRQKPVVTEEEVEVPADTVIASLGEQVDSEFYKAQGVKVNEKGVPMLSEAMESSKAGVYLIGDGAKGPATVVMAIRDAQVAVNHYLGAEEKAEITVDTCVENAADKKGVLAHSEDAGKEANRCLECNHICENCVDVCPNRANVSVKVPGSRMPAIVHVDYMCNECGNCKSFCPYDSAPYKEKFTLFANEEDFANSENDGFVILDSKTLRTRVRVSGSVTEEVLSEADSKLFAGLKNVIVSMKENYSYMML